MLIATLKRLGLLLATLLVIGANTAQSVEEITFYHNDALGSPVLATDASGAVKWREQYTPYGSRLLYESRETDCSFVPCEHVDSLWDEKQWYTGKLEESRVGLQYFGARWYDPSIGRFLSIDPVEFQESNVFTFNRYAYANNNPYKYLDPDGQNPVLAAGRAGWVIGGGLNTLVYHATGAALTTIVVDAVWNALHNESSDDGDAKPKASNDSKRKYSKGDREKLADNAGGECEYCGDELDMKHGTGKSMEGDHIESWAKGGRTTEENGAAACRDCNRSKSSKELGSDRGQFNPSNPNSRIKNKMRR